MHFLVHVPSLFNIVEWHSLRVLKSRSHQLLFQHKHAIVVLKHETLSLYMFYLFLRQKCLHEVGSFSGFRAQWEDTLRDNLLNFASTAKGILLLQQTGALNECMLYMHTRYEKKLQVIIKT